MARTTILPESTLCFHAAVGQCKTSCADCGRCSYADAPKKIGSDYHAPSCKHSKKQAEVQS